MCRWTIACGLTLTMALPAQGGRVPAQPAGNRALLIGIDDYVNIRDLRGAVNDIERVRSVLMGRFGFSAGDIVTVRNGEATRTGILSAFDDLIARTQRGDVVYVHYSGHGSRLQDDSDDEEDGWDETIVPHDSREAGIFDITDDQLNVLLSRLTEKTPNVTIVLDSCHSGSATRGGSDVRRAPDDHRRPPAPPGAARAVAEGKTDFAARNPQYVLITGSMPNELSNEFDVNGSRQGVLTHFLTTALLSAPPSTTYRAIMETVAGQVTSEFGSQHPQIEGAEDRVLFGVERIVTTPYVLVHPRGAGALIDGGTIYGLAPGSELDVFPPGAAEFEKAAPLARVRVKGNLDGLRSEAEILSGGPVQAASRGVIRTQAYPDRKLRIHLVQPDTSITNALRRRLEGFAGVELVSDEANADMLLRHDGRFIYTLGADLVQLSPPLPADSPGVVDTMVKRATDWMRWFAILRLQNAENPMPISVKLGDGGRTRFVPDEEVEIAVTNLSSEQAFMLLLDLEVDGAVTPLTAPEDRDPIPPFGTRKRRLRWNPVPAGRAFVPDVLKVIMSAVRLDPAHFSQAAARSADPPIQSGNPLDRLIGATTAGQSRAATVVSSRSWGTAAVRVETWQPAPQAPPAPGGSTQMPRLDAFVLHFPEGSRATPASVASRGLSECPITGLQPDECWEIEPLGPSSAEIELRPAGRRAQSRSPLSLGAAWDQAERLRVQTGAELVEPVFEVALDDEAVGATRSGGSNAHKGGTQHPDWSLKYVDAFGARERLRTELGKPMDAEATGVLVAHPDTGYRQHPELWLADPAKSPVMFESGWNFVEDNPRPLDPLHDSGTLPNPGHGTKSGSVIVSPIGKQWPGGGPDDLVHGIAPGARLVPLRVHTSVVHFNPSRLAASINHAAEPDGVKVRLPAGESISVISISMGGLPSLALYKAVRNAEKRGVVLVAAAGNKVKTVVWPARFGNAVAVAATNIDCGVWNGSSRGGAVDFAAPGESVWHADVKRDGTEGMDRGFGTTYATATTAGVAALWVARHRGTELFERLKREGRLTDAFRAAVRKTSWRPGGSGSAAPPNGTSCTQSTWDSSAFGAGIVHAARLLAEPLAEPPATRADADPAFPLFHSLFQEDVPVTTSTERLTALFPGTPVSTLRSLDAELATLYALDDEIRQAVDALATPAAVGPDAYQNVRATLRRKDVSSAMAAAAAR